MISNQRFGPTIRSLRTERGISLRKFAARIGITPTYLSKIEREEVPPPAEDKIQLMAKEMGQNPDELLALAGRVAADIPKLVQKNPKDMADFLREASELSGKEFKRLHAQLKRMTAANKK